MASLRRGREISEGLRRSGRRFGWPIPRTIRGKLVALTAGLFLLCIWTLACISVDFLQDQFDETLLEQQYAAAQQVAAELDTKLEERIALLTRMAGLLPADLSARSVAPFLAQRTSPQAIFSGGVAVIGADGVTIADYPVAPGRSGSFFGDRDYFRRVMATRQPYIDKPVMGRALRRPVLTIAVPVFDPAGKIRAVMTGITDMAAPNFLGAITDRARSGPGEYFIISRDHMLIVAATDGARVLEPADRRGRNPMVDRMMEGYEGSGFGVNSRGIAKLYSAKQVRTANWIVVAALPADVARRPVLAMQRYLYGASAILTLLAVLVLYWMTRRVLLPLEAAGKAIRRMTAGEIPLAPVPVGPPDEVGQLIGDFNQLVEERRRYEAKLEATNKELHAFTYAASHDMKAPLGRIHTFSALLEQSYRDRLDGDGRMFLDLIRRNAKRLVVLVEDLLVHAEFGQNFLSLKPLELRPAVEKALAAFDEEIRQGKVELRLELEEATVVANPQALAQVLRNLLENALRYSSAADRPVIEIGSRLVDGHCRVRIKDNGIGFDMAYHDRIFEVLRRLHTYEEFPGSGVGLALVKKAMECMGGKVWAESEPGHGATFYLQFRVADPAGGVPAPAAQAP